MTIYLNIAASLASAVLLVCVTRQIHMFQLNMYKLDSYFGWLKTAFSYRTFFSIIVFAALTLLLFLPGIGVWPFLILLAATSLIRCYSVVKGQRQAIKKLVFTTRVKRLYVTSFLLLTVAILLFNLLGGGEFGLRILTGVILLCTLLQPVFMLLVNLINRPAEKLVALWYINDAKKILRRNRDMKVIGITGSYGKTSTKFILGRILSEKYNVTVTPESFNTLLGIVITIRTKLKPGTEIFVVEMGAKRRGEIKEICDLVNPTAGIITSIGPQHLETFRSLDNIVHTKFELADAALRAGGRIYLNNDNEYIHKKAKGIDAALYGIESDGCRYYARNIRMSRQGSSFDICGDGRVIPVTTKLLGRHNVANILGAAAIAMDLGVSDRDIKFAVEKLAPVEHRLEMKPFLKGSILIDDSYNSNPSGSVEAVNVVGSFDGCRKIVVTPGMVELGEKEYECNYHLGLAMAKVCDEVVLVGEQRAIPMLDALKAEGYPENRIHVMKTLKDAMGLLNQIVTADSVTLFENDLPDNYAR